MSLGLCDWQAIRAVGRTRTVVESVRWFFVVLSSSHPFVFLSLIPHLQPVSVARTEPRLQREECKYSSRSRYTSHPPFRRPTPPACLRAGRALCMCSLDQPTCSMYGVHECYHCKSVPNRSEPVLLRCPGPGNAAAPLAALFEPSFSSWSEEGASCPVYSVITAALVLACGYSVACSVHSSPTTKSGKIAASSSLSITTLGRQFAVSAHWASRGSLPICSLSARRPLCLFGT
ncbi:hypothetical protein GGI43DRAFT_237891 [Trichoderma evansii]